MSLSGQGIHKAKIIESYNNSIQIELFGHGGFYSLNYERLLLHGFKAKLNGQIGLALYPAQSSYVNVLIPLSANAALLITGNHYFEAGAGHVFIREPALYTIKPKQMDWEGVFSARLGYRFEIPGSRLIIRSGFTPLIDYLDGIKIIPWGGFAIGYRF
jgi:hypothetical protein